MSEKILEISINQYKQLHGYAPSEEEIAVAKLWLESKWLEQEAIEPKLGVIYHHGKPIDDSHAQN